MAEISRKVTIAPLPGRASSLRGQIYETLRGRLQRGEVGPRERLVDVDIADRLGVSRMPVREALLQLMNEGYLVGTTRGFVLPTLGDEDIADIFEVRRLLEPRAAANAARDIPAQAVTQLRRALEQARRAQRGNDVEQLALANTAFRRTWLDAVRNRRLAATISRFVDHVQIVRSGTLHDRDTQSIVIDGLERLLDAFVRGDAKAAEGRMAAFIAKAEKQFFAVRRAQTSAAVPRAAPGRRKAGR